MSAPMRLEWRCHALRDLSPDALYAAMVLRQRVFVVEQTCFYLDADGRDLAAKHLLGWVTAPEAQPAHARVFEPSVASPEAGIGRVVTTPELPPAALVAYARVFEPGVVYPEASIGRVVTAPEVRGLGLGRETVRRALLECAGAPVRISAQARLRAFYESLGFSVIGPEYDEDGIPHLPMRHPGAPVTSP